MNIEKIKKIILNCLIERKKNDFISEVLNNKGIKTPSGTVWNGENVEEFIDIHLRKGV